MFQSAPANYGGRIVVEGDRVIGRIGVSIRARQLRRANHPLLERQAGNVVEVSIRARQLRRANPYYRNLLIKFKY